MKPKRTTTKRKPKTLPMPGMVLCKGNHCDPKSPLPNNRWEGFCYDIVAGGMSISDAYRHRYKTSGYAMKTVNESSSRLLRKVSARIEWLKRAAAERTIVTQERVLEEIAKIAFCDLPGIIDYDAGTGCMRIESFKNLTPQQRSVIESFKIKSIGFDEETGHKIENVEIKLYSKQAALEQLGRYLKMFTDKVEHGVEQGVTFGFAIR